MPRWAGFRRQGRDVLFKVDRKRGAIGMSQSRFLPADRLQEMHQGKAHVVGYEQLSSSCARFYEIYAYTQPPVTGDHSDRLADRPTEQNIVFFCILSSRIPIQDSSSYLERLTRRSHTLSSVPEGQHTRTTPPEPARSSRKPQDKALPPTGLCATESVESNQGVCVGVGDPDPPHD
ncbi:unnamed protein product [Ectocarpus sp. 12 AP-2014]